MKKILLIGLIFFLIFRIYSVRAAFLVPFDKEYWYDRYYESQWVDPVSKNPISDAGLYKIAGYDLATTHVFFKINPEAPPLGKYIYGYSILLFNNAEVASLLMYLAAALLFYKISTRVFKKSIYSVIAFGLFLVDPLLFEHATDTLLDLPQLIALLIHVLSIWNILDNSQKDTSKVWIYTILAGVSFGAFIASKFAFLGAVILIADLIMLLSVKKFIHIFVLGMVSIMVYFFTYIMYFVQGHSIREFLGTQKWILTFYLSSQVIPVYGTVFTTLFYGMTKGWHEGAVWERVKEWTILWSLYISGTIVYAIMYLLKKIKWSHETWYVLLLTGGLTASYIVLPFFTRYLILTIPFMILLTLKLIKHFEPVVKRYLPV